MLVACSGRGSSMKSGMCSDCLRRAIRSGDILYAGDFVDRFRWTRGSYVVASDGSPEQLVWLTVRRVNGFIDTPTLLRSSSGNMLGLPLAALSACSLSSASTVLTASDTKVPRTVLNKEFSN